ncbi:MAG TPA: hypothetical protein ACFYEK_15780 [Candidatus Wunengus sp. YC60]|uniref:hypothetical protein n=1 Tax=Candidatus Wunengus sp. YC60 TaxID=3367697 RepID=UPI004024BB8F
MIPSIKTIRERCKLISKDKPITIITPIKRYLGFSAPVSPVDQLSKIAEIWGVPFAAKDPQRLIIKLTNNQKPLIYDEQGPIDGSVFYGFGHETLDRLMVRFVIAALEKIGKKVINGEKALTVADDKGLMALALANHPEVPTAFSVIGSARGNVKLILKLLNVKESRNNQVIQKLTGFSAGGVGTQPLPATIDHLAPALWASRMDTRPRVIQNDVDGSKSGEPRKVIRAYVVGGRIVGCYITEGYGIVNCAGLARESQGYIYTPTPVQRKAFLAAAKAVGASGFCRIDASGGKKFVIYEINPLARIDAEKYGLHIPEELLWYAVNIATQSSYV